MTVRFAIRVLGLGAPTLLCLGGTPAPPAGASILHYTVRLHSIPLLAASFCFRLDQGGYEAAVLGRTVGLVDMLTHGRSEIHVEGAVDASGHVHPRAYTERSRLSGDEYGVTIDYPAGDPVLRVETPPQDKYRLPIPPTETVHAIDGVSALVVQSLAASRGVCAGDTRVYDGRQVGMLSLRGGAVERLAANGRSVFQGEALRCETQSRILAGFPKDQPVASQSKPMRGKLWLAAVPEGGPVVPVRMVFDAKFFGDIVVQLDGASRATAQGCGGAGWSGEGP